MSVTFQASNSVNKTRIEACHCLELYHADPQCGYCGGTGVWEWDEPTSSLNVSNTSAREMLRVMGLGNSLEGDLIRFHCPEVQDKIQGVLEGDKVNPDLRYRLEELHKILQTVWKEGGSLTWA